MTISLSGWALDGITGYYRNARTQKSVYSIFKSLMDLSTGDSPLLPPLSIPTMTPSYDGNFQGCTIGVRRHYSIMDQLNLQRLKALKDRKRQSCAPLCFILPTRTYGSYEVLPTVSLSTNEIFIMPNCVARGLSYQGYASKFGIINCI
jgi:hypothetical protein